MILKNSSLSWDSEWGHMQSCRPVFFVPAMSRLHPFPGRYKSYKVSSRLLMRLMSRMMLWYALGIWSFFSLYSMFKSSLVCTGSCVKFGGATVDILPYLSLNKMCVTRDELLRPACNFVEHTCVLSGRFVFIPRHFATSADACFHFLPCVWRGDLSLESILWETRQVKALLFVEPCHTTH